ALSPGGGDARGREDVQGAGGRVLKGDQRAIVGRDLVAERGVVLSRPVQPRAISYWELHGAAVASGGASGRRQRLSVQGAEGAEAESARMAVGRGRRSGTGIGKLAAAEHPAREFAEAEGLRFPFP